MPIGSRPIPTQDRLLELFEYRDGNLFWKVAETRHMKIGAKVGYARSDGYGVVYVDRLQCLAHRMIWLMHYGWLPKVIDHINGDPSDNRIENLRVATQGENLYNKRIASNNTSGVKGVNWDNYSQSWKVIIGVKGKSVYLGRYKNIEDAASKIAMYRNELHGEFARHE